MKNKSLILCLTLLLVLGLVGCARQNDNNANKNNTNNTTENPVTDNTNDQYYDIYTRNYDMSLAPLGENYTMYGNLNDVEEYYKTNEYPGNKKYLQEVKDALNDSKDNVEQFINNMEKDAKSDNQDINKLNREMIEDGRDLVEDINESIRELDRITDQDLNRSEVEFRRLVGERIDIDDHRDNDFTEMLRNLENRLGIDRNNGNNNNKNNNNK